MSCNNQQENKMDDAEKICDFLKAKKEGANALQISKGIGLVTAKDVNGILYRLNKAGRVYTIPGQPPLWSLEKPQGAKISGSESAQPYIPEEELRRVLRTDSKGMRVSQIGKELCQSQKVVKKHLYDMQNMGKVENSGKLWIMSDEAKCEEFITYKSDDQHLSIRLTANSRFAKDFESSSVLGAGGFGCVTKAKLKLDGKYYAVKIVKNTGKADKEVKALAELSHPNIVRYYTVWIEDTQWVDLESCSTASTVESETSEHSVNSYTPPNGARSKAKQFDRSETVSQDQATHSETSISLSDRGLSPCLFIKMEFCEGGTLKDWIVRNAGTSKEEPLMIFQQIVHGVEHIHSKGFIHRDLKPENILFGSGSVKIGDFGLVTTITSLSGGSMDRTVKRGTPSYMSPEQETMRSYDEKTDIFSLGLICFELLWKMPTIMEKYKVFKDLRAQIFPEDFGKCMYFIEHKLISTMLSERPAKRPDAKEIAEVLSRRKSTGLQQKSV